MTDIVTGKDADFSEKRLGVRYNSDLANNIGNLLNRTLNMAWKYRAGKVTTAFRDDALFKIPRTSYSAEDLNLLTSAEVREQFGLERIKIALHIATAQEGVRANCNGFREQLDRLLVSDALLHAFALATSRNRLVDDVQPWKLAKDPNREADLDAVLYDFVDMLRIIAILISPVLPRAAHGIFDQLNWKMELSGKEKRFRLDNAKWGGLPDGHVVGKPVPLFPRIEI
jgi:methionyl-tRNA synthetase